MAAAGWEGHLQRAPVGVLVLGALLFLLGAGLVLGGAYLGISRPDAGLLPWVAALLVGPLLFYASLHLVRLTPWAWLAMVLVLVLLLISSVVRAVVSPQEPLSPLFEGVVEGAVLIYLARPHVRAAFGRA